MRTKKPDHYIFPAIFNYADDGISISFPDLPGCLSCGDDQKEAMYMAQDVLAGFLSLMEDEGESSPEPSDLRSIHTEPNEAVVLVDAWMVPMREKTVRKNLTIPAGLAWRGEKAGINFSQLLTDALDKALSKTV